MKTDMENLFLTQEVGSIQRPIWRQKLNAPAKKEWVDSALNWGERLNIEERFELANDEGTGLLQKPERTPEDKQRVIDISTIYVIKMLETAGLGRVFNGEQPRTEMYDALARRVSGIETAGFVNSFDANYFRKGIVKNEVLIDKKHVDWFVDEFNFANKHSDRIVKPCLTGPYTMTDWSYVEYYRALHENLGENPSEAVRNSRRDAAIDFARNVLNPIVKALVTAGATVVQIDEPAAATNEQEADIFVESVNACFDGIPDEIEKAVHLCYSEYSALFPELTQCVADTYLIECTNRAAGEKFGAKDLNPEAFKVINLFKKHNMNVNIGAGVIDIHSDVIETPEMIRDRLLYVAEILGDPSRVQVNPDCGLRTRTWDVAFAKLENMVKGAEMAREIVQKSHKRLSDASIDTEILFEIVPPSKMSSEKYKEKMIQSILDSPILSVKNLTSINIPEITDENWQGKPYYRNTDTFKFTKDMRSHTTKNIIVNKVVVHCDGFQGFKQWLQEAISQHDIKSFIFVGPNSTKHSYPGPTVLEANKFASQIDGISIGNILIPSREGEAQRMLKKTLSGATFFTTQILFESERIKSVLSEYSELCKSENIKPAKVFLSFCPISKGSDIEFLRWLGVEMPQELESDLLSDEEAVVSKSIDAAKGVWKNVSNFIDTNIQVPVGINVEEIFLHNLDHCNELILNLIKSEDSG